MPHTDPPARIGIIGAGAMGTSLAAITARFAPTVIVERSPARASQLFEHGVRTAGELEATARPVVVSRPEDLEAVGGVRYLFIATKTSDLAEVCRQLRPVRDRIADDPDRLRIISYQNGVEPGRQIIELLETTKVMRMVLNYGATMHAPDGHVHVHMHNPPHHIGCLDDEVIPDCRLLAGLFTEAGLPAVYEPDIELHVWRKAVVNAAFNPVCALINGDIRQTLDAPSRAVIVRLLEEGAAVSKAEGHDLGEGFIERAIAFVEKGADHLPSMVHDIRGGRPTEVGQLNSQIVRHAERVGIEVPTHQTIDELIETFDWRVYHAVD